MINIIARDLDDAWFQALMACIKFGKEYTIERGSFEQCKRRQLDFISIEVMHPGTRPIIPSMPESCGLPAPTDMNYVNNYLSYLMEDRIEDKEIYTYGSSIKRQIQPVIEMLKNTPKTNQACMTIGTPNSIFMSDPECLRVISFKLLDNKLNMSVFFRSWDLLAGMPSNLAGLQLFKEYICQEVGCEDGKIFAASDGLHLYDYQYEIAEARTGYKIKGE